MAKDSPFTRTHTANEGPLRPAGTEPCLTLIFACDQPRASGRRYGLGETKEVLIGRGLTAETHPTPGSLELRFEDAWMSARHARLMWALGRWMIEDAGSKNGTVINGVRTERARLAEGDLIEIGQRFFVYRDALAADAPASGLEHFSEAVALALDRIGSAGTTFLPSAARELLTAWPLDLDLCLSTAIRKAAGSPIAVAHLPSPLPTTMVPELKLAGELWSIRFGTESFHLKDSDGLRYLAHLIARPGVEVHATELLSLGRRGPGGGELETGAPLLDPAAKAAYRQRLIDLRLTMEEAENNGDLGRSERAQEEIELLSAELSRAVGLGGRDRQAGSTAERARSNVTMRIRNAMKKVGEISVVVGRHLEGAVQTGTFCSYRPAPK